MICDNCIHARVCEKLEDYRDPLCFKAANGEVKCDYFDAVPVEKKRGHWFVDYHPLVDTTFLKCSECKLVTTISPRAVIPDECPECGAKMEVTNEST